MNTDEPTRRSLSGFSVGLGVAGLLPIPGIIAAIAAVVCGQQALRDPQADRGQARLGMTLGVIGIVLPVVFVLIYCVVLGYPFPIHRYHPGD